MCKIGDIILVEKYKDGNTVLSRHSFVVIEDRDGTVEGLPYDMICNVLSSYKGEKQKQRKLSYPGNFPVSNEDTITNPDNGGSGYIKADQLYYFNKNKIDYRVIGYINEDILDLLFEFIEESEFEIVNITDNL